MLSWLYLQTVGLWPIVAHYTFAVVVVGGCLAIWLFSAALAAEVPLIQPFLGVIRRWALIVALVIVTGTICYAVGVSNGQSHVQAKWDAAEKVAVQKGKTARSNAVRNVRKLPASGLRGDPDNRDND